jgi:DNA repair protein RadC
MSYTNTLPMQQWCEDDRASTKILLKGRAAVSDSELLSLLIAKDTIAFSSLDTARKILNSCNDNLGEVGKMSVVDLLKLNLTSAMAIRILAAFEVGKRRTESDVVRKEKITTSSKAYDIFRACLGDIPYEEFWIILLNRGNKVLQKVRISEGGVAGTVVDPKKIFKIALDHNASSIILGHNHPSGNIVPSEADMRITKQIKDAGTLLEIFILDHIIVGDGQYYSFADQGEL